MQSHSLRSLSSYLAVGASFAVLDRSGILRLAIARIVQRFGARKYLLLLAISFVFMLIGALFGIFEEVVPLVPIMLALSYFLGWDSLVGLGMSILATNMGFSAAITNPFTIGVAQKIAGLPLFSGAWLRVLVFIRHLCCVCPVPGPLCPQGGAGPHGLSGL